MKLRTVVLSSALLLLAVPLAKADTMTYTFDARGTGSLGGVMFSSASFVITVVGDTNSIIQSSGLFSLDDTSATILISGFSLATFVTPTRVFDNQSVDALGFSNAGLSGTDLLDISNPGFGTYALVGPFGPVFDEDPFAVNQFNNISTTLGTLDFFSIHYVTFSAGGSVSTPEPATFLLLGGGLLGLAAWLRRRKYHSV